MSTDLAEDALSVVIPPRLVLRHLPRFKTSLAFTPSLTTRLWEVSPTAGALLEAVAMGSHGDPGTMRPLKDAGLVQVKEATSPSIPHAIVATDHELDGMLGPRLGFPLRLELDLLDACNLRCSHCRTSAGPGGGRRMTQPLAAKILGEAAKRGVFWLSISGGEPTLHPDLEAILKLARRLSPWHISVATNGTTIDTPGARSLLESEVDHIVVSLDGLQGTHEALRGTGTFEPAVAFIALAATRGTVTVNTTLTPAVLSELPELCEAIRNAGATGMRLGVALPAGRALTSSSLSVSAAEMVRTRQMVKQLTGNGHRIRLQGLSSCNPDAAEGLLQEALSGCYAGRWNCFVDPAGIVRGCKMLPEYIVGDVNRRSIQEVWANPKSYQWFFERRIALQKGDCAACDIVRWCGGGCPAMGSPLRGDRDRRCLRRRAEVPGAAS